MTVKMEDVREGDTVILDGGFTCVQEGAYGVLKDQGGLFFQCSSGKHYLDGQDDGDGILVGVLGVRSRD